MNIRDLQYLVAVYELQNFSKAAERCFVSQPTLSGQLKKLEEELGVVLMERSTRKVLFTPLGVEIVEQARAVLATVDRIKYLASHNSDPMAGDFHLGLIPTVGPFLLPRIMAALNEQFPQTNFYLYELRTDQLIEKLLKGELDAAILAKLDWDVALSEWPLYEEALLLAMPDTDSLGRAEKSLDRSVLEGQSLLMLEDGHCLRDQAMGVCFAAGADEDSSFQATSMDTLLHMVAAGRGMTLIPQLATINPVPGIRFKPFADPAPSRDIVLIGRAKTARSEALGMVAELVAKLARSGW